MIENGNHTNLKYADSSLNYYVIMMVKKFLNFLTGKFQKKSHSRGMKCQPKANNNREAVVVCARHVVKRPSKRMRASYYETPINLHMYFHVFVYTVLLLIIH